MVIGALLLLQPFFGLRYAMHHAGAFLNVAQASDPATLSITNNIVLCTTIAGFIGLALLCYCAVSFMRSAHHAAAH